MVISRFNRVPFSNSLQCKQREVFISCQADKKRAINIQIMHYGIQLYPAFSRKSHADLSIFSFSSLPLLILLPHYFLQSTPRYFINPPIPYRSSFPLNCSALPHTFSCLFHLSSNIFSLPISTPDFHSCALSLKAYQEMAKTMNDCLLLPRLITAERNKALMVQLFNILGISG